MRRTIATTMALACGALAASPAVAAPRTVSGGSASAGLLRTLDRSLHRAGVGVRSSLPARRHGSTFTFPATGGRYDFVRSAGAITLGGSLRFTAGHRVARVTSMRIVLAPRSGRVLAKVAGRNVVLFSFVGRTGGRGLNLTVRNLRLRFTNAGARAVNRALHRRVVRTGGRLFTLGIAVRTIPTPTPAPSPVPPAPPAPAPAAPGQGQVNILGPLAGMVTDAIAPGLLTTDSSGLHVALPIISATFDPATTTGLVTFGGGLDVTVPALLPGGPTTTVALRNPQLQISATGGNVTAEVNGVRINVLGLDAAALAAQLRLDGNLLHLLNVGTTLSPEAAALLRIVPGTTGLLAGGISVTLAVQ